MNKRKCKNCDAVLGRDTWKCPSCGQANFTATTWVALVLILIFVVPIAGACISAII